MKTNRLVRDSLRTMARFKLRSAFIMLGALVGVAAVSLAVSIGKGAERKMLETMRQLFGASSIMILSGGPMMGGPRGDASRLTLDDGEALAEELPGIEVHRDELGRVWVKSLGLSARLLNWFVFNAGGGFENCKPSQPLATIGPVPFSFRFSMDGLGAGAVSTESTHGKFSGTLKDGGAFQAGLSLRQSQYRAER